MMLKRLSWTLLIGAALCVPAFAQTTQQSVWQALLNHDLERAAAQLGELQETQPEAALQARLYLAWTQGDWPQAAEHLEALIAGYPQSDDLPAYLAIASQSMFQGWPLAQRIEAFRQALEQDPPPVQRALLHGELSQAYDMKLNDLAVEQARHAGTLIDHWQMIGPFGKLGDPDLFHPFGPERGWEEGYAGWLGEVQRQALEPESPLGMIFLDGLVAHRDGIVYLLNTVEAQAGGKAQLVLHAPRDVRVWWNGEPVLEKCAAKLETAARVSVPVSLRQGANNLTIKTPFTGQGWLRARLLPVAGSEPPQWQTAPFEPEVWHQTILRPFGQVDSATLTQSASASLYPLPKPEPSGVLAAGDDWLRAMWHLDRRELAAAREALESMRQAHPQAVLAHTLFGEISQELARVRPASRNRFLREAEAAFHQAREIDAANINALVGLIAYSLELDQPDQALELLREFEALPASDETLPYQGTLDHARSLVYAAKGFQQEAADVWQSMLDGFLPRMDIYQRLFDYYRGARQFEKAAEVIDRGLQEMPLMPSMVDRALRLGGHYPHGEDLRTLLQRRCDHHPQSVDYALDLGEWYERHGQLEQAYEHYQAMSERFPHHPQALMEAVRLATLLGQAEAARQQAEALYQAEPTAMTPFRMLRDVGGATFPYQAYDVQLEDIDLDAARQWEDSRAKGIYLIDNMVLEFFEDGAYAQYVHQAIQVLNQEGIDEWAEMVIPKGQNVEIIMARTITPDGEEWAVSNVQDLGDEQALSMYGIEEGAVIEYAYLQRGGRDDPGLNVYKGGYFFGSDDDPMVLSQLTLIRPETLPFQLDRNPEDFAPVREERKEGRIITTWKNEMQEGLRAENFAPPLAERVPSLQWTTTADWLTFAERQQYSLLGTVEPSPELDRLAERLAEQAGTAEELIHDVYEWVRTNIESGSGGATTADTLALRAGNSFAKLRLAQQLLERNGLETELVNVFDNEEGDGYRPLPFPNYGGALVLRVPAQEGLAKPRMFHFQSRYAGLGDLSPALRKDVAFEVERQAPGIVPLQPELWEQGLIERRLRMRLLPDRSAEVAGQYSYRNQFDLQVREMLSNPEIGERLADAQLAQDLAGIRVQRADFEHVENVDQPPRLVFAGEMPDALTPSSEGALQIRPVWAPARAAELIGETTRQYDMVFRSSPVYEQDETRIDCRDWIEAGARIEQPDNVLLINEFGYYALFFAWDGPELVVRRSFLIPPQTIEPELYPRFVTFCRRVDQIEQRTLRIDPMSETAP